MAILNGYATLDECKTDRRITSTDTTDDGVLSALIENASRLIDEMTGRWFYPRIQTRHYDMPSGYELRFNADLLSLTTLTNGDDTTIASTEYTLKPRNDTPYWAVVLKQTSNDMWTSDDDGNFEAVIDVLGVWGYHTRYAEAWRTLNTISAAITTTTATTFAATSGTGFSSGQIVKIDDEYMLVTGISTNTITVERGWNGSTAATHLINSVVYVWRWQGEVNQACRMIVNAVYSNRFGQNTTGSTTITAAGVVINPSDIPAAAFKIIDQLALRGW